MVMGMAIEKAESGEVTRMELDDDGRERRTGTLLTASAHIITAVIGSGVLSLAWAIAQLGWLVGATVVVAFGVVTWFCSGLLADCYRSPDPVHGKRNYTYKDAVKAHLGGTKFKLCGAAQYANLIGATIGYSITTAISIGAIKKSNCYHKYGHDAKCDGAQNESMMIFACVQLILSQIPDFHKLWWLSYMAAIMSFGYSFIGLGLSIAKIAEGGGHVRTSLTGVTVGVDVTGTEKIWRAFQALGNIAFAYTYSNVLIEIQDTLKSSPPENRVMKKASLIGVSTTSIFYLLCGLLGYAAFGNKAPGNFLTGFGFYEPFWLIDIGNVFIIMHLVGAYQVFAQPFFQFVETSSHNRWPESRLLAAEHTISVPQLGSYLINYFRLAWRTGFVAVTTLVAMTFPFFNAVLGLIGAISFWPLTVYFPIEMHIAQAKVARFSGRWTWLKVLTLACLIVAIAATVGSIQGLVQEIGEYKPFGRP